MISPSFFVITGGPGSGKTTLLAELARRGHVCVPEDARALIQEQVASGGDAVPWANAIRYAELLLRRSICTWRTALTTWQAKLLPHAAHGPVAHFLEQPVYFDRGVGDTLTCAELIGHALPDHLITQAQACRYRNPVFLAPWWPEIYITDTERRQSELEAERTQHAIAGTYASLGYTVLTLPLTGPVERAEFVLSASVL